MQCNRTGDHIKQLFQLYHDWRPEEGLSAVITTEEAARNDYSLSPSRCRKLWCCCAGLRRGGVLRTRDWTTCRPSWDLRVGAVGSNIIKRFVKNLNIQVVYFSPLKYEDPGTRNSLVPAWVPASFLHERFQWSLACEHQANLPCGPGGQPTHALAGQAILWPAYSGYARRA